jgi:hypothetical protein
MEAKPYKPIKLNAVNWIKRKTKILLNHKGIDSLRIEREVNNCKS